MGRRTNDRGAAAVEFALVVPMLLLLVFGIIEFGRIYNIQASITAAARQGARVMALKNDPVAAKSAAETSAQPYVISSSQISLGSCPSVNTTNAIVRANVTYPVNLLTGWFGTSITLHGTGVMRCNG